MINVMEIDPNGSGYKVLHVGEYVTVALMVNGVEVRYHLEQTADGCLSVVANSNRGELPSLCVLPKSGNSVVLKVG